MVRVKICGLKRLEDALLAVELGADALGFVFYPKSPRYVTPEEVLKIISKLPPFVTTVGVFVNETRETVAKILEITGLDLVQFHGDEPPSLCASFFPRSLKAFRVKSPEDLEQIKDYQGTVRAILLDTFVKGLPGGTGQTFDWELAVVAQKYDIPIILAGGLNPENVALAMEKVRPFGLDLSSGVEKSPGLKDPSKMRALFKALFPFRKSG